LFFFLLVCDCGRFPLFCCDLSKGALFNMRPIITDSRYPASSREILSSFPQPDYAYTRFHDAFTSRDYLVYEHEIPSLQLAARLAGPALVSCPEALLAWPTSEQQPASACEDGGTPPSGDSEQACVRPLRSAVRIWGLARVQLSGEQPCGTSMQFVLRAHIKTLV